MARFQEIKKLYADIRNCNDVLKRLIEDGKTRIQQYGENVIYRDLGLSEGIVKSFAPSDEIVAWLTEINESASDSDVTEDEELEEDLSGHDSDWTDVSTNEDTGDEEEFESQVISNEEHTLAGKFRDCCDAFGREIRRHLPQTAEYLLQYGRMYLRHATKIADENTKIDQKLNFLRAAALVNAAIVRYDILELYDHRQEATKELRLLHEMILENSVSQLKKLDFVEFSQGIKTKIELLRKHESNRLRYVTILRNRNLAVGRAKEGLEEEVIATIRNISESNSKNYSGIMTEIIEHCLEIMGERPCDFVIAGLGSLARNEVTLSSDFEHVIILDDKAVITEEVREYFRWFTVIFHVVVIGLGETVVPSIDIKSLSDQYSSDPLKKWFKDEYTPCGISFDGMMPHACKCPLGRQKPTTNYDNIVELIQPASVMANYLTADQDSENGYLLQDILQTTVFVYGSIDIYNDFLARSDEIIQSFTPEGVFLRQREMIHRVQIAWDGSYKIAATYMNIKGTLYRPLTVLLHCISSILGLTSKSSFSIIDELKGKGIINEECHQSLSHALAIVLELRMRCYRTRNRQRNVILDRDLSKLIPEKFLLDFRITVIFLFDVFFDFFFNLLRNKKKNAMILLPTRDGDYWQCYATRESIHYLTDDESHIENILGRMKRMIDEVATNAAALGKTYYVIKTCVQVLTYTLRRFTKNNAYQSHDYRLLARHELREIYFWSRDILMLFESNVSERVRSLVEESYVLYYDGDLKKSNMLLNQAVQLCETNDINDDDILDDLAVLEYRLKIVVLRPKLAVKYFSERCEKQETYYRECCLKIGLAEAHYQSNNIGRGRKVLDTLVDDVKANSLKMPQSHYSSVMFAAGDILLKFGSRKEGYSLQEEGNRPRDAKFAGEYPDDTDMFINLQITGHYKYNYGTRWNVGRYSNFTFNSVHYELPLPLKMLYLRYFNALHVFSCETYSDMIALIQYFMDNMRFDDSIPQRHYEMWKHTQAIGIMALCENVKFKDMELFGRILNSLSATVRRVKILQPFIYACMLDYMSHPQADSGIVAKQKNVFKHSFEILRNNESYSRALLKFRNFKFNESLKILWRMFCIRKKHRRGHFEKIMKLFLTSVLAAMISRERNSSMSHLRKCRVLSMKQAVWMEFWSLDESHRETMASRNIRLSKFYKVCDKPYALLHNLALDFETYDERAACALLWKLIHSRHLNKKFACTSVYLLFEILYKFCDSTLVFSLYNRQQ